MSECREFDPSLNNPEPEQLEPPFKLVAEAEESEEILDTELLLHDIVISKVDKYRLDRNWEDVPVEISVQAMTGSSIIPVTPTARIRSGIMAIERAAPDSLFRPEKMTVENTLKALVKELAGSEKIGKASLQRWTILSLEDVVHELEVIARETNHPVAQALDFVRSQHSEKLSEKDYQAFKEGLVSVSYFNVINDIYKDYIAAFRALAAEQPDNLPS